MKTEYAKIEGQHYSTYLFIESGKLISVWQFMNRAEIQVNIDYEGNLCDRGYSHSTEEEFKIAYNNSLKLIIPQRPESLAISLQQP